MCHFVGFHMRLLSKFTAAYITRIRALSCVNRLMVLKMKSPCKSFAAYQTEERPWAGSTFPYFRYFKNVVFCKDKNIKVYIEIKMNDINILFYVS